MAAGPASWRHRTAEAISISDGLPEAASGRERPPHPRGFPPPVPGSRAVLSEDFRETEVTDAGDSC